MFIINLQGLMKYVKNPGGCLNGQLELLPWYPRPVSYKTNQKVVIEVTCRNERTYFTVHHAIFHLRNTDY